jgi:hypothetical protein
VDGSRYVANDMLLQSGTVERVMKVEKKLQHKTPGFKNTAFLAPHRAIDESPAGDADATRHLALRDLLRAPGQIGREHTARNPMIQPDEIYGGTQIPRRQAQLAGHSSDELDDQATQEASKYSGPHSPDPRKHPEKKAEKERKGLDREFGTEQ